MSWFVIVAGLVVVPSTLALLKGSFGTESSAHIVYDSVVKGTLAPLLSASIAALVAVAAAKAFATAISNCQLIKKDKPALPY